MIFKHNVTLFICQYCRKAYQRENACIGHETFCCKNPENVSLCGQGCKHLTETTKTIGHDGYTGYYETTSKAFFCNAKQVGVYPLKVEQMGLPGKYPEDFYEEIQMPSKCEHFDDDSGLPF